MRMSRRGDGDEKQEQGRRGGRAGRSNKEEDTNWKKEEEQEVEGGGVGLNRRKGAVRIARVKIQNRSRARGGETGTHD